MFVASTAIPAGTLGDDYELLEQTKFSGGEILEREYIFSKDGGSDNSLTFELIKKSTAKEAYFNVSGGSHMGSYPENPSIDVGDDSDEEWKFSGTGYGSFGFQDTFTTGRTEQRVFVPNAGSNNRVKIKLPQNATVTSANLTIEGTKVSDTSFNDEQFIITLDRSTRLSYAESDGDGTFSTLESLGKVGNYYGVNGVGVADFDNDGNLDYIAAEATWWGLEKPIHFFRKIGTGKNFATRTKVGTINPTNLDAMDMGIGDFDKDKNIDFFMCGSGTSYGRIYWGDGTGKFFYESFDFGNPVSTGKSVADINDDGYLDMVVIGGSNQGDMEVYWYENDKDGGFKSGVSTTVGIAYGYGLVTADFNNDGYVDLLTGSNDGKWFFSKGDGTGTFSQTQYTGVDVGNRHPGFGDGYDFNFDGNIDLICSVDYGAGNIKFYEGNGDGTFKYPTDIGNAGTDVAGIAGPPTTSIGSPINLSIDIGDDGDEEWSFDGEFLSSYKLEGDTLKDELNSILSSSSDAKADSYGNMMVDIPIKVSGDKPGYAVLKNLEIKYDYTARVELNPHNGDLKTELNELISFFETEYNLNVTIPVKVKSDTNGRIKISDLYIKYQAPNMRPKLILPSNMFQIYEDDSRKKNFIDMDDYVFDDFWPGGDGHLRYELVYNSHPDQFTATIHSHFMDVMPEKNFFGLVELRIKVTDEGNDALPGTSDDLFSLSNYFNITVLPTNDRPDILEINGYDPHDSFLQFNATENHYLNLTIKATDIDQDPIFPLKFTWQFQDSSGVDIKSNMNLVFTPGTETNETGSEISVIDLSYIPDQYEVNIGSIYITLTVSDNNGSNPLKDIIQFVIRVINVNDPPKIKPISTYNIDEDKLLRIPVYATDNDGDILEFSTNRTDGEGTDDLENLYIDSYTGLITFTPYNKDVGLIPIMVIVDDGAGESNSIATRPFLIFVNNTNDRPHINVINYELVDADPATPNIKENLTVKFSTDDATDDDIPYNDKIFYQWDFDNRDGFQIESEEQNPTWTFPKEGKYTVTLRVRDNDGFINQTTKKLTVIEPDIIIKDPNIPPDIPRPSIKESLASTQGITLMLLIIILGVIIGIAVSVVIKKRKVKEKEEEEEVTPFTDKELKVVMPDDIARDLATRIRLEKGIYTPPKVLKQVQAAKDILGHTGCSTPAECTPLPSSESDDALHISLPAAGGSEPMIAQPAQLPPAPESAVEAEAAVDDTPIAEPVIEEKTERSEPAEAENEESEDDN